MDTDQSMIMLPHRLLAVLLTWHVVRHDPSIDPKEASACAQDIVASLKQGNKIMLLNNVYLQATPMGLAVFATRTDFIALVKKVTSDMDSIDRLLRRDSPPSTDTAQ